MDLQIQNAEDYEKRGSKAMAAVEAIAVTDETSNTAMGDVLTKIKLGMKTIEEKINDPIEKANQLHKWLTGIRTKILTPWKNAEALAKKRMGDFQYQQMVIRREAQRKEAEETMRLESEQMRKAQAALDANQPKKAAAILDKPVQATTVIPPAIKTEKQTAVFMYSYEVQDINLVPREFMVLDTKSVNAVVQKLKMDTKIPGIKVIESAGIRSR